MKVMHICNDYSYSKVYMNLYTAFDNRGIEQVVFHPLRNSINIGKNSFDFKQPTSKLYYSKFLVKSYYRIFFKQKINKLYKDILSIPDLGSVDITYPTTLFSDGALALKLYLEYNIPYIVAVRNTDVNLFLKYRPDLIGLCFEILKYAKKIVFISEGLKEKFYSHYLIKNKNHLFLSKTIVISNGIDNFWIRNIVLKNEFKPRKLDFLFIGRFDNNKNILRVIRALEDIRKTHSNINLNLVGGGGNNNQEVLKYIRKNSNWIKFHGFVSDKDNILKLYRESNFFLMPSIYETFGLVYIEALSQGLPVLYTKNQGIDGLFSDNVGKGVYPDVASIKEGILDLINQPMFDFSEINFDQFDWEVISHRYEILFNELLI